MKTLLYSFMRNESGVTTTEAMVIIAVIVAVLIAVMQIVGPSIVNMGSGSNDLLNAVGTD